MENYKKGKNVENPLERDHIPVANLPSNFLWMHVRGGSKIRNLLVHALNEFSETQCVVWTGFGPAVGKTISCAEIMKRELGNNLHQITKLCYRDVEEYWDPILPELDQLVVKRKLPMIHIVLSNEKINEEELGQQPPGSTILYTPSPTTPKANARNTKKQKGSTGKKSSKRTPQNVS